MARILVAGFCAVPGPHRAGVQLPHVLRALTEQHSVEVLTVRKGDQAYVEQFRKTRMLRVPVGDVPVRQQIESFRRALHRQLEGAEYDAVHFRDGWAGVPVLALRERLGYLTIFDPARGPMAQAPLMDESLGAELAQDEHQCIAAANLVLAPTEPAVRYLAARGADDRVRLVPPGVDVDTFDWDYPPSRGPARVFYGGLVRAGRGIRVLLRAMVEVCARTDARLVLAGPVDPAFARVLHEDIQQLGLSGRVDFLGAVDNEDMPAAIARATICVSPAALELARQPAALYPTKILEYMACRRVVVAPRRGTVTMLMTDGEHGLLFTPGDHTDLAAQVLRLLADPPLRDRLAGAAYERVRHSYTASATRRALRTAYRPLDHLLPKDDPSTRVRIAARAADADDTSEVTEAHVTPPPPASGAIEPAPADDVTHVELAAVQPVEGETSGVVDRPSEPGWVVGRGPVAPARDPGANGGASTDSGATPVDVAARPATERPVEVEFAAGEFTAAGNLLSGVTREETLPETEAGEGGSPSDTSH